MTTAQQPTDAGFHAGELTVQRQAGVGRDAANLAGMLEPADLDDRVAAFLGDRRFLVVTARDRDGRLWTTALVGPPGFLEVRSSTALLVRAAVPAGNPLHLLPAGQKVGLTAIEFATRRRIRINGILREAGEGRLLIIVEQAYGNCPQYIQKRELIPAGGGPPPSGPVHRGTVLDAADLDLVRSADTFFLGTIAPGRGADASHRGGQPGFVRAEEHELWWPDYPGNNLFNSFGNLATNPEAALLFVDFADGRTVHISGTCTVGWGAPGRPGDDGRTGRIATFAVQEVVAGGHLPIVGGAPVPSRATPP